MSVIVTAFDQGELVAEAVESVLRQTLVPDVVIVVDDGSTDDKSVEVVERLRRDARVQVLRQSNRGVSAARNAGIAAAETDLVAVLDGDDRLAPTFLERTVAVLQSDPGAVAASSWLRAHGVIDAVVQPGGGSVVDFLHRNACPAAAVVRRDAWRACGGYDEGMRSGFEDWDFFLSLVGDGGHVTVVREPLIEYRNAPASANVRSMDSRLELYGRLVDKHRAVFERHLREVLLALEARAMDAARRWEDLVAADRTLPVGEVTYGDGGMAAAVRIAIRRG
ncbi:glycosyltransferase family 2 protein [Cellulomonas sp.]|uniref:glycosyltransferase family 2 protein n=1 Tax=Cellulomonas sp. TaxID=40001 RepID=UPI003BAD9E0C